MTETCGNCRFWRRDESMVSKEAETFPPDNLSGLGICARYPPIPTDENDFFPVVHRDRWCGEWDAAPPPPLPPRVTLTEEEIARRAALRDDGRCMDCGEKLADCECLPF